MSQICAGRLLMRITSQEDEGGPRAV